MTSLAPEGTGAGTSAAESGCGDGEENVGGAGGEASAGEFTGASEGDGGSEICGEGESEDGDGESASGGGDGLGEDDAVNWTRRKARSRGNKKWRRLAIAGEEEEEEGSRKCGSEEIELKKKKKKKVEGVENLRSGLEKGGGDLNLNGGDLGRREKPMAGIEAQIW